MTSKWTLDAATLREIAVEASSDPRTVARVTRGEEVRGLAGKRINAVLARRGIHVRIARTDVREQEPAR